MISQKKCYKLFSRDFFVFKNRLQRDVKASSGKINELLNFANRWSLGKQTNHSPLFVRWEWLINWNFVFTFFLVSQFRRQSKPLINWLRHPLKVMFCYNASLKLSPNRWTLGIATKVLFSIIQPPTQRAMMGWKFPSRPLVFLVFNLLKWLELFSFLFLIFRIFSRNTRHPNHRLIQFHVNLFRHYVPFVTNCLQPPQTRSCITEKNILLPSQCLIHLHGKWI